MSTKLVFFLHRLGIKVYQVKEDSKTVELADIPSLDSSEISQKLESFSGNIVRFLVADTISYLFHCQIDLTKTPLSRDVILEKIKSEIPENTELISWDYKLVSKTADQAEVIVFTPVVEFQKLISNISKQLKLTVEAIEPESISTTRHPNPIIGITLKEDLGANDDLSLNISLTSKDSANNFSKLKPFLFILAIILFVGINYFLYQQYIKSSSPTTTPPITDTKTTITPTTLPTPTVVKVKKFSDLKLLVQNGTNKAGYAGSIAAKFKENGLVDVTSSNADREDYSSPWLSFASEEIKNTHLSKFNEIFPIPSGNIRVDKSQSYDAILILGIN